MKTPMKELMDEFAKKADSLPDTLDANVAYLAFQECYDMAKSMLKKEKEAMCEFAERYLDSIPKEHPSVEDVYNETFNTKEK